MYRLTKHRSSFLRALPLQSSRQTRHAAVAVLVLCLAAACGCGRKTAPRPPEMVAPEVVGKLEGGNTKDGILLHWERPTRYADGSRMLDLGGFRIERSTASGEFEVLSIREVTDRDRFRPIRSFRYLDGAVAEGEVYRYRVLSFTTDGYFSSPSRVVEIVRRRPVAGEG